MSWSGGWAGPAWGEPSGAAGSPALLRRRATAPMASYRADGGRSGEFLVLAASVGGVSHRLAGRRCEDSFGWVMSGPGRLALVVADGVGSAGRGGEGAELAVEAACGCLGGDGARDWGPGQCRAAISAANQAVYRSGGAEPAELATTIVVALLWAHAGRAQVTLGRVGDSCAFVLLPGGEWREVFGVLGSGAGGAGRRAGDRTADEDDGAAVEDDGAMLLTATASLPSPSLVPGAPAEVGAQVVELAAAELEQGAALVLLTDGIAQPLRDGPTTVAPRLAEALQGGRQGGLGPLGLACAVDFSRRGAHDDRTVLVAWPLAGGG